MINLDYLFEVSWEVCNKVGGIHTVIETKSGYNVGAGQDRHIYIGPLIPDKNYTVEQFREDSSLFADWQSSALKNGLKFKVGRWNISSSSIAILVDYTNFLPDKDEIFTHLWLKYGVDSLTGHGDYIDSTIFGYAAAKTLSDFIAYHNLGAKLIVAHFHEWMTGASLLYIKQYQPNVATVFTTHATTLGRSIAGNNLPLYNFKNWQDPDSVAKSLSVTAKHSLERCAAQNAHVFTTVSSLTANECKLLLGVEPHLVTPNGINSNIAPEDDELNELRAGSRKLLLSVAQQMTGNEYDSDTLIIGTSGRYEYRNKGLDLFLESLSKLREKNLKKRVIAFIFVPSAHQEPQCRPGSVTTHRLIEPQSDMIVNRLGELGLNNDVSDGVNVIFAPIYLNGNDGLFNLTYYQVLAGLDVTVFPSYYEPWGYTPLESLAFGVPTITTNLAGFGLWMKDYKNGTKPGIEIITREESNFHEASLEIAAIIDEMTTDDGYARRERVTGAKRASKHALWERQIEKYIKAYKMAVDKISDESIKFKVNVANAPQWATVTINRELPDRIKVLDTISKNLWWCWHDEAMELFKMVDVDLWRINHNNPIAMLDSISYSRAKALEKDTAFLRKLDKVHEQFNQYMATKPLIGQSPSISYFSMEYGLDHSLKIYSGGLGVLAGDYLKESSDGMIPLTAVGILYRYGYFNQTLSPNGDQIAGYEAQDFNKLPVEAVKDNEGNPLIISIDLPGRRLKARAWRADVGRTPLYLLDTDFDANSLEDRAITHHLYGGDLENRFRQEILLGVGGIRLLRALGINSEVYHCNEGHAAFTGVERLRELVADSGMLYGDALEVVRSSSLFTTHTPVPAGHDAFPEEMLKRYISHYPGRLNISWEMFMSLGKIDPNNIDEKFSMSNLACNLSQEVNGVSMLHGKVSREIMAPLWPGYFPEELHIGHVTNGVHYPTWAHKDWKKIREECGGFDNIYSVDDRRVWDIKNRLRRRLIDKIKDFLSNPKLTLHYTPQQIVQISESLRSDVLTIGFARRFATYKRAHLLFTDMERLDKIVNNPVKPVQFIFAGKAHPADKAGQDLIKHIVEISLMPEFIGKIIFLPGYDMNIAKRLIQGVDIWMNTPTRPLEASGTSGEKAAMNGVMHFSVLDGWWVEGYKEGAGWALPMERTYENQQYQDELDAATIYNMLENEIVPVFYDVDPENDIPRYWVNIIKNTIAKVAVNFTTTRMMNDYMEQYYRPLAKRSAMMQKSDYDLAKEISAWKRGVCAGWGDIEIKSISKPDSSRVNLALGKEYHAEVILNPGLLTSDDIGVEFVLAHYDEVQKRMVISNRYQFKPEKIEGGDLKYICSMLPDKAGTYSVAVRMYAKNPHLSHRQEFDLVKWL